jgi:hypothetical protein
LNLRDLERIKDEFESINKIYRTTFSFQGRLELMERVKKLLVAVKEIEEPLLSEIDQGLSRGFDRGPMLTKRR